VEVEDRLAGAGTDVDDDLVVLDADATRGLGDELEHALRLLGRELLDLPEGVDVPLGQDEQVRLGLRVDVADRGEPLRPVDVVALARERAEEAVLKQRGSPPR
jgi:hypothetical protein